ncbi:hypothetical protein BC937DRAFT_92391, partial [Endogone sp. FLAS-F59071]
MICFKDYIMIFGGIFHHFEYRLHSFLSEIISLLLSWARGLDKKGSEILKINRALGKKEDGGVKELLDYVFCYYAGLMGRGRTAIPRDDADFQDVNYKVSSPPPNAQYNVNGTILIDYELLSTVNTYVNSIAMFFVQGANNYTITLNADLSQSTARNATDGNPSWQLSWPIPNSTVLGACT